MRRPSRSTAVPPRIRRAATIATAAALLCGAALTTAPTAGAVGGSACDHNTANKTFVSVNTENLAVRSGPAASYKRIGTLESLSGRIYRYCTAKNKSGNTWWYGKVSSPSYKTVTGWVYGGYF